MLLLYTKLTVAAIAGAVSLTDRSTILHILKYLLHEKSTCVNNNNDFMVHGRSQRRRVSAAVWSCRQKYWSKYCRCSLMWLMPLRSLSNCDYQLKNLPRLILGPIHPNQVMGMDPVGSYHGTRNSWSNSINPTYPYQSHD